MFKHRFLTTLVLVPFVLCLLFYAPSWLLALILLTIITLAGSEWTKLIPLQSLEQKLGFLVILILLIFISSYLFNVWLLLGLVIWLVMFMAIILYPNSQLWWGKPWIVTALGLILLTLFANTVIAIFHYPHGLKLLVYLLFLVWAADIGAYVFGKLFGKHKVIPKVSPGKTIEGTIGGLFSSIGVATLVGLIFHCTYWPYWLLLALITAIISIFGDLFISMLKRRCTLKDTGSLLPGHGGILDRIDSLIAAVPWFYAGLKIGGIEC